MDDNSAIFHRKSPRANFHDYSGGDYFITICTADKKHYFGEIVDGKMKYSEIGRHAEECLAKLPSHYSYLDAPLFVVMPNHIHAIFTILDSEEIPKERTALGVVVGGFKQSVTRFARRNNIEFEWQSRYHDHIIRNNNDGNNIAEYIKNNPTRWSSDCFYT